MSLLTIEEVFAKVNEWGRETFPKQTIGSCLAHLGRELAELETAIEFRAVDSVINEEIADCFFLFVQVLGCIGVDWSTVEVQAEMERKLQINKGRKWGKPDAEGVVEHIREEEPRHVGEATWNADPSTLQNVRIITLVQPSAQLMTCAQCGAVGLVFEGEAEGHWCPKCGASDQDE